MTTVSDMLAVLQSLMDEGHGGKQVLLEGCDCYTVATGEANVIDGEEVVLYSMARGR